MLEKKYALFCGPTTLRVWNVISRSSLVWKLQETFSKFCVLQLKRRLARLKSLLRWKVYCAADISTGWPSPSYCYCYSLNKLARKSVIRMRTLQLLSESEHSKGLQLSVLLLGGLLNAQLDLNTTIRGWENEKGSMLRILSHVKYKVCCTGQFHWDLLTHGSVTWLMFWHFVISVGTWEILIDNIWLSRCEILIVHEEY